MPEIIENDNLIQEVEPEEYNCYYRCFCCKKRQKMAKNETTQQSKGEFWGDLPKNLNTGKLICVSGTIQPNCSRFAVNLTCGKTLSADIAFHFNPRLQLRYVVRNSRINGQWGDEETTLPFRFDFTPTFALSIFIAKDEFLIAWNKIFICSYKFRMELSKLTNICIAGDVVNPNIEYFDRERFPQRIDDIPLLLPNSEKNQTGIKHQEIDDPVQTSSNTPVTFLLPEGFQQDWQLEIYGRVKILPHSFYINLQDGAHRWPHPVVHLHLNTRFCDVLGEPLFIRNAWIDGGWGQEERAPGFQFSPGSPFAIAIRRGGDRFSVSVDGKLAGEFKFRSGDTRKIDALYIQGDVLVNNVILLDKAET